MRNIYYILLAFLLLPLISGCEKDEESTVVIVLENFSELGYCKPDDVILFKIHTFTKNERIENLKIVSEDIENGNKVLLDSVINQNNFKYTFAYKVPAYKQDTTLVSFVFSAKDNTGVEQSMKKHIKVTGSKILEEYTGLKLYSGGNNREDVLFLGDLSKAYNYADTDSANIDIYSYYDKNIHYESLSREWRTNTDVEFVKNNTYDYSSATSQSLNNIFVNSRKSLSVKDLQTGDVVIIGKAGEAWGAFHIVNVIDSEGTNNDYYLINYKKMN